jgi:hypothetical protein
VPVKGIGIAPHHILIKKARFNQGLPRKLALAMTLHYHQYWLFIDKTVMDKLTMTVPPTALEVDAVYLAGHCSMMPSLAVPAVQCHVHD